MGEATCGICLSSVSIVSTRLSNFPGSNPSILPSIAHYVSASTKQSSTPTSSPSLDPMEVLPAPATPTSTPSEVPSYSSTMI